MTPSERPIFNRMIATDFGWTYNDHSKIWFSPKELVSPPGAPHHIWHCYSDGAPDFFEDPAFTRLLIERMMHAPDNYDFYIDGPMLGGVLTEKGAKTFSAGFFIDIEKGKFSEAVADCYCKMKGWLEGKHGD